MKIKLAKMISKLMYPALTGAIFTYILYISQLGFNVRAVVYATIFSLCISLFPYLIVLFLIKSGKTDNRDFSVKESRRHFFRYSFWSYILALIFLLVADLPKGLFWVEIGALVFYVVYLLITPHVKISFHTGGMAFNVVAVALLINWRLIGLFPLVGLIIWSRLTLKKHTLKEAVLGMVAGGLIPVVVYGVGLLV